MSVPLVAVGEGRAAARTARPRTGQAPCQSPPGVRWRRPGTATAARRPIPLDRWQIQANPRRHHDPLFDSYRSVNPFPATVSELVTAADVHIVIDAGANLTRGFHCSEIRTQRVVR